MSHDISAPIHAAKILLNLPTDEYRPAIAKMAAYMRNCVRARDMPPDELETARSVLDELERKLW